MILQNDNRPQDDSGSKKMLEEEDVDSGGENEEAPAGEIEATTRSIDHNTAPSSFMDEVKSNAAQFETERISLLAVIDTIVATTPKQNVIQP